MKIFFSLIFIIASFFVLYINKIALFKIIKIPFWEKADEIVLLITFIFLCQVFTWLSLLKITNQYTSRPVSKTEMWGLSVFSSFFNSFPFVKAGFFGRAVWLNKNYGLSYSTSTLIVVELVLTTMLASLLIIFSVFVSNAFFQNSFGSLFLFLFLIPVSIFSKKHKSKFLVLCFRTAEVFLIACRYFFMFSIFSINLSFLECTIVGVTSVFLMSIPLLSGGAGIREWGIATLVAFFIQTSQDTGVVFAEILFVDLVMRGIEVLMFLILGIPLIRRLFQKGNLF